MADTRVLIPRVHRLGTLLAMAAITTALAGVTHRPDRGVLNNPAPTTGTQGRR